MSSARISSAGLAETESLLALLQRKSAIRSDLLRPSGADDGRPGFSSLASQVVDFNSPASAGKYSISSETMAFLLTVQQSAGSTSPAAPGTARSGTASAVTAGPGAESRIEQLFRAIDTDRDGKVVRSEFISYIEAQGGSTVMAEQIFRKIDPADTGFVTRDRITAAVRLATEQPPEPTPDQPSGLESRA